MSPYRQQRLKEAGYDVRVGCACLALLFGFLAVLPRSTFWYWMVPLAAFWIRYNVVRQRRSEWLLRAELLADGGSGTSGCYRSEAGICITDGSEQFLVARQKPDALLQLPKIV